MIMQCTVYDCGIAIISDGESNIFSIMYIPPNIKIHNLLG